jgi:hypothetical protein
MSVAYQHGLLPANRYVINHDIMNCTAEGVVGNHLYSARALGMSEPWDIVQLHPSLRPHFPVIRRHYRSIGLSFSENIIWDLDLRQLGAHIGFEPSVFYFGPHECRYWGDSAWLDSVEFINSKNNFMTIAKQLGVDVPITECFSRVSDISDSDVERFVYPCYLKAAVSVSGVGIFRCENKQMMHDAIKSFDEDTPVQVQEEVVADSFLNLQYHVVDGRAYHLAASEQILDGFAHQGNRYPASHEPWHVVDPIAEWLVGEGMKGIFAFDVAVVQTDRGLRFSAIECNPRFNGASYPTMIAHKLDIPHWSAVSVSTQHRDLGAIDLDGIEYCHRKGEGVILVNWGTIEFGKLVFLVAGSAKRQDQLFMELGNRL